MKKVILILFFLNISTLAQQLDSSKKIVMPNVSDTLPALGVAVQHTLIDTTKIDTVKTDTIKSKKKFDVDAVVYAAASDSIIFDVSKKKMFIYGKGELKYKDTELKSGKINVDYNTNELEAFGILDTSDTAKVKLKQTPILKEGAEIYEGSQLRYNFKTQRGFISLAKNEAQGSRYEGEKVKKVDKNIYFIKSGMFTTCEKDTPHTYFTANEMKVIQHDKIIARWIFMYIGGVPLPIPLPFAVFPSKAGRRSGIIVPSYGQDLRRGQYFYNFGYFWAVNDYMDVAFTGDYYSKGGYGLRGRLRYAQRYNFTGSFNAGYSKIKIGEPNDPINLKQNVDDWNLSWYHNQQINPTTQLNVNLQFYSSSYLRNNSIDYNDILSQNIISNATLNKRWEESGNSLYINYSRTQNLISGDIYESLPNITFSKNISYPFKSEGSELLRNPKWYEQIGYTYTGQFTNNRNKQGGKLSIRGGIQHNININASPKIGYFSVSPRINYTEKWYNKRIKIENKVLQKIDPVTNKTFEKDTTIVKDINELNFVRTFDLSVLASTKLYGIFQPNVFGIEAFRHTLIPSISYNYQPDFSNDFWGYYDYYTNSKGEVIRYDKFSNEVFSGAGAGEKQSLNLSFGNVFEIKTAKNPIDTSKSSESNKIQLLNLTASIGYNFAAQKYKLSDLYLTYRTQVGNLLSFNGSSSYTFYDYEDKIKVNKYLISAGKGLFRLTNFSFSISTNLSGEKIKDGSSGTAKSVNEINAFQTGASLTNKKNDYISHNNELQTPDFSIPWNLSLSYNFNMNKTDPSTVTKYSNVGANLSFSLTKNWKFTIRGSYDFELKQITAPQITVYRDLHCWEMNFIWNPIGYYRGFRFEIRMKAPELQDIKITKSRGLYSGRR